MKNLMKGLRKVVALSILAMALVCGVLPTENATAQEGVWTFDGCSKDEFEDRTLCSASSPKAETSYTRSDSQLGVACSNDRGAFVAFRFDYLNLIGVSDHVAKMRFDKEQYAEVSIIETDTDLVLLKDGDDDFVQSIAKHNTLLIGLDYYSDGLETFRYSLNGAEAAIAKAYEGCGIDWALLAELKASNELWNADRYSTDALLSLECEENAESKFCSVVYDKDTYGVRDPLYICNKIFGTFSGYFPNDEGEKAFSAFINHPLVVEAIARCDEE